MARRINTQTEAGAQETLFQWAEYQKGRYPELKMLFHIPNGGKRNAAEAAHLKRQGVKAGVPDLFLPVPRGAHHGLFIELKAGKNKPTKKQIDWIEQLTAQGYYTAVCWGWESAARTIVAYLDEKGVAGDEGEGIPSAGINPAIPDRGTC